MDTLENKVRERDLLWICGSWLHTAIVIEACKLHESGHDKDVAPLQQIAQILDKFPTFVKAPIGLHNIMQSATSHLALATVLLLIPLSLIYYTGATAFDRFLQ